MRNWRKESIHSLIQSRTTEMKVNGQVLLSNHRRGVCNTCEWEGPLQGCSWGHLCGRRTLEVPAAGVLMSGAMSEPGLQRKTTVGTSMQWARVGSWPGKHQSLLIQISLASNGTEREHALSSQCLEVSYIWLRRRTQEMDCQKVLMRVRAHASRAWILPQPLNPGLPWVLRWSSGCAAILDTKAKEWAELRSTEQIL